jgi:hypothetical protein
MPKPLTHSIGKRNHLTKIIAEFPTPPILNQKIKFVSKPKCEWSTYFMLGGTDTFSVAVILFQ